MSTEVGSVGWSPDFKSPPKIQPDRIGVDTAGPGETRSVGNRTFTDSELLLAEREFWALSLGCRDTFSGSVRIWLLEWQALDLSRSPMPDDARSQVRLGHYHGWMASRGRSARCG